MSFKIVLFFAIIFLLNTSVYANNLDDLHSKEWGVLEQYTVSVGRHKDKNLLGVKEYYLSAKNTDQDRRTYFFVNGEDGPFSIDYHGYQFKFESNNVLLINKKGSSKKVNKEAWSFSTSKNTFNMSGEDFELVSLNERILVLGFKTNKFGLTLYEYLVLVPSDIL